MLYNNSKDVLNAIKAVVAEDRQKYVDEKTSLEGRLQLEEMKKMKMEYVVPEEIEKEGVAHFMGAAAAAHKAGKKQFAFGGKTYPVKIKSHIAKQVNETLKGNQHKIDANKNGKIDAQDFKMLRKEDVEVMDEATITQGSNKGKQWTPSTTGPTNKIKPSSKDLPAPMDGATAPPPKAAAKGMKKEGIFDTIGSKIKSAFSGGSPVGADVKYGATSYGSGTKSGWSGDATGSSQYSRGVTSTSASSSLPSGSLADFLKNPGIKPKTEASSLVNKVAKKIKSAVAPEVKPIKMKMKEEVELSEAEQKDTPGQHVCAVHVKHQTFGEGKTLTTQHADPAADGSIAWYDVMFEHGIEKQVPTSDLEIILAETHAHCKDKK